jgi:glutathione S-transferase
MKLYSGPLSLFTAKVRVALAEKGLDYERIDVPFSRRNGYSPKLPEMLAINPKGQVPVLIDGDLSLYDSTIICEYLEDRYPKPPLYPADVAERARCRQAEAAADEIFFPHVYTLITEVFYKPEGERDGQRTASARQAIGELYGQLDARLAGRDHLFDAFSVADIAYVLTITFASGLGAAPPATLPHLAGWMERVTARPTLRTEIAGMSAAMAGL